MAERRKVHFRSGDADCAAWHYAGTNGSCVVMAAGLAVIKEAGTDLLAARLVAEGFSVLAFDYRHLGESGGQPRQIVDFRKQLDDFDAAIACAKTLPGVDPRRIAIWGFSLSGGHVYTVARRNRDIGGAISHAGAADAAHAARYVLKHFSPGVRVELSLLGVADRIGRAFGRRPILVPLSGERGELAAITTPDSRNGREAVNPGGRYDDIFPWEVDAWSAVRIGFYRPGRRAAQIKIPLLVLEFQGDGVTPPGPAAAAAKRAPHGELVQLAGGHYAAIPDGPIQDATVEAMVSFLSRHLLDEERPVVQGSAAPAAA